MERDIHDGAQQQLVALAVQLGLLEGQIEMNPGAARRLASQVKAGIQETVESIRDLARGIFPPLLADQGLIAAIQSHISKMEMDARVEATGMDGVRFAPEVEANVYFCVREALQNASKHAPGARVTIRLIAENIRLSFVVADRGPGFDPASVKASSGLQNMRDRVEAIGGAFEISAATGRGTEVKGTIPARTMEPVG